MKILNVSLLGVHAYWEVWYGQVIQRCSAVPSRAWALLVVAIACSCQETGGKSDVVSHQSPTIETRGGPAAARASVVQPGFQKIFVCESVSSMCQLELGNAINMSLILAPVNTFDSKVGDDASSSIGMKCDWWRERFEVYKHPRNISDDTPKRTILLQSFLFSLVYQLCLALW